MSFFLYVLFVLFRDLAIQPEHYRMTESEETRVVTVTYNAEHFPTGDLTLCPLSVSVGKSRKS